MRPAKIGFGKFLGLWLCTFGVYPIYYWVTRTEYILDRLEGDYHA